MNFNGYMKAVGESFLMIGAAGGISVMLGFLVAVVLVYTKEGGLRPNLRLFNVLDFVINVFRSFPFIIMMILLFPVTRFIVGTSIGTVAATVPLTIAAIPFAARIIENSLNSVEAGVIEAARSFGARNHQIILRIMLVEALPSLVQGITNIFISIVAYSAMAGAIGGGGLGAVAINYGYYRRENTILLITVVLIFLMVQMVQSIGNLLYRRLVR